MTETNKETNKKNIIPLQPYKGTQDLYPNDLLVLQYIFNKWREVCLRFGYKEYLTPLLELADLYRAKSGEDIGGKELFTLTDLAGRDLAIRPEMTPSVTRIVAKIYKQESKPIRYFSVANFLRNERPQKGRNREFWQLNADIFGENSLLADLEILSLAIELMKAFGAPKKSFMLYLNSRNLINDFLKYVVKIKDTDQMKLVRLMDKFEKYENQKEFEEALAFAGFSGEIVSKTLDFLTATSSTILQKLPELEQGTGLGEVAYLVESLEKLGYLGYFEFKTNVIRGFDYYDGMIFEVFDLNKDNRRSLFGGGRYNGLASVFGVQSFPATGFAPGSETFRIFLENWGLLPEINKYKENIYFPLLNEVNFEDALRVCNILRGKGFTIEQGVMSEPITQAFRETIKKGMSKVFIFGQDEIKKQQIVLKDLQTGIEEIVSIRV